MKLNYSFSKREIALILVLVLVLIGLLYYRFVYLGISAQVEQYNTEDLEMQTRLFIDARSLFYKCIELLLLDLLVGESTA